MKTRDITRSAILLALLIVCSQISIPMWPVPITLQTLAVLLIGMTLAPKQAFVVTATYMVVGLAGLPIFAGFKGGPASFTSPAFGFIIAFVVASYACAAYLEKSNRQFKDYLIAGLIASIIIYAIGVPYLGYILNAVLGLEKSLSDILKIGMTPFLLGDLIKLLVAVKVAPVLKRQLSLRLAN